MNRPGPMQFSSLTNTAKQMFLARLGHELTIAGRAFVLERHGEQLVGALTGLNELQHRILSQISALNTDADGYPDDVFWAILDELAANHSIADALARAIVHTASQPD